MASMHTPIPILSPIFSYNDRHKPSLSFGIKFLSERTGSESSDCLYDAFFQSDQTFYLIICVHINIPKEEQICHGLYHDVTALLCICSNCRLTRI